MREAITKTYDSNCAPFTHGRYEAILLAAKTAGYHFGSFGSVPPVSDKRPWCLLRHDCDNDLSACLDMALLEHRYGVSSTWFVMLRSPMYNAFSAPFSQIIRRIMSLGHQVGLHFDALELAAEDVPRRVEIERELLGQEFGMHVNCVSFHQPSQLILDGTIKIKCVNTYAAEDLPGFHYYSDSNMVLREGCPSVLFEKGVYRRLQLLIHPEWWTPQECSIEEKWRRMLDRNFKIIESTLREREDAFPGGMSLAVGETANTGS